MHVYDALPISYHDTAFTNITPCSAKGDDLRFTYSDSSPFVAPFLCTFLGISFESVDTTSQTFTLPDTPLSLGSTLRIYLLSRPTIRVPGVARQLQSHALRHVSHDSDHITRP